MNVKSSGEIIKENLAKNVELYNKYTMLLTSIFISALTAIGNNGNFNIYLKISILLFSISLSAALLELALLIINDSVTLKVIKCNFLREHQVKYMYWSNVLAFISLAGFLLGLFVINIFIFTIDKG